MSAELIIRDLVDQVWNGNDLDRLASFYAHDFDHDGRPGTIDALRSWHRDEASMWSDTRYEIVDLVCGGDRVALRWTATATHVGKWGPVPPTGKTVTWNGVHFFTVASGRIVAMWAMGDMFAKAMQLGVTVSYDQ